MHTFFKKWWSPLITFPAVFVGFVAGLPYGLHKLHLWHHLTLVLIGMFSIIGMMGLSKIHTGLVKNSALVAIVTVAATAYTWPTSQLGNWPSQFASHILAWSFIGYATVAGSDFYFLYQAQKKKTAHT